MIPIAATSRSTSPSSRLRENYSNYTSAYRPTGTISKTNSGIPRSLANSRETSPNRATHYGSLRKNMYSTNSQRRPERPPLNPGRLVMAQKILQQSRDAENALADALVSIYAPCSDSIIHFFFYYNH